MRGLIIDNFAGGGGASAGIYAATGRHPDFAINHDREALRMHEANHPTTVHLHSDVWEVDPREIVKGRRVALAWFSPDCKHFSRAKGAKPVDKKIRGLAWVAAKYAELVHPDVIFLENVNEFQTWGPLLPDGTPDPAKKGFTFRQFTRKLEKQGYNLDFRELIAKKYGTPTVRERLFMIARRDGKPIVWPEPTHGPGLLPYRTAAECIDFSLPTRSIFGRTRPLADNTMRRIARGVEKFVLNDPQPFIVGVGGRMGQTLERGMDQPMQTITSKADSAVVVPVVTRIGHTGHGDSGKSHSADSPLTTITSKAEHLLVLPYMVPRYGERPGQDPRCMPVTGQMPTVVPTGNGGSLVAAFLAKHNGGNEATGQVLRDPCDTITAIDSKALVLSHLMRLAGNENHMKQVRAFLKKYLGNVSPIVTIDGEQYMIVDIHMRMLTPRELATAQGFPLDYDLECRVNGKPLTARAQTRMIGNSVCPQMAEALVRANCADMIERELLAA